MATYAIGDIQGCYTHLRALLDRLEFDPARDVLWTVGDLVNRGPHSLEVLRFFYDLGERTHVVLGNHDMHLLAVYFGDRRHLKGKDTFDRVLHAPDCDRLLEWLRHRPLLHHDTALGYTMIHAGLPPQWSLQEARTYAAEAEAMLQSSSGSKEFLAHHMYGDKPKHWSEKFEGWERQRFIINCLTRLRYCTLDGKVALKKKYGPGAYEDSDLPWFKHPRRASRDARIVFGHWSTLGLHIGDGVYSLDTGCLWGGHLTALRLEDAEIIQLDCPAEQDPLKFV